MTENIPKHLTGLTDEELKDSRVKYGFNEMAAIKKSTWLSLLLDIMKEPMLLLLVAISIIYVIVGDYPEAIFMFGAIIAVSAISFYQDTRSKKALEALEKLNEPLSTVIRNSIVIRIPTRQIALGDLCITEEGKMINADGVILHSNDFSVNESALTGESYSVFKDKTSEDNKVYSGTIVVSGLAVFKVEEIGRNTRLGRIGESLEKIKEERSPLQIQIGRFVRYMAIIGVIIFLAVWIFSYVQTKSLTDSLLVGLTMAMSVLPEEIPVAFTTFMALGAWKLMREGIIIKRSTIVETLGSTTVICADKTGTITENTMHLKLLFDFKTNTVFNEEHFGDERLSELISYSMWSSEPVPFDPMEKALHQMYEQTQSRDDRHDFKLVHEYPLEGKPPMMTHIFENSRRERITAAKGAPEAILSVSDLSPSKREEVRNQVAKLGKQGYRILGVAKTSFAGSDFPAKQQDFIFEFLGLTVFYDPPKAGISHVFRQVYDAGIQLKVITGDNADTTMAIAQQSGIRNAAAQISGMEIMQHTDEEISSLSEEKTLFTRMFPDAKLTVVNALKKDGEVVAMLGDGVNDAPALKAAHIGVAMGHKGTEIAKAAASLVITNDDLGKLITGIAAGRRIYANLKKAIQYIISIHIPIILTVSLPLFLGWVYPEIFTPVHVIFLELIMGPTCSIVYENEPIEKSAMIQKPRKMTETFLNWNELAISIVQGLIITAGVLFSYQWMVRNGGTEEETRGMVFTTLVFANIFLSLVNRSFYYSIFESFRNKNRLLPAIIVFTLLCLAAILFIAPVSNFFKVGRLNVNETGVAALVAVASVLWLEVYKWVKRKRR